MSSPFSTYIPARGIRQCPSWDEVSATVDMKWGSLSDHALISVELHVGRREALPAPQSDAGAMRTRHSSETS